MPITLLATQCPAPQVPSAAFWIQDNAVAVNPPSIPHADQCKQGLTSALQSANMPIGWNKNAARLDMVAKYGAGAMGVCYGLVPTAGSGLLADVSAGHANISGIVEEYAANTGLVLGASVTNFIWLRTNGTTQVIASTTPPVTDSVLLGAAITNGSAVTSIDMSGVVKIVNGIPERETADPGKPGDTPPSTWRGWTKTLSGMWWWDGSDYQRIVDHMAFNKDLIASGESVIIPVNHQVLLFSQLRVSGTGTLKVQGKLKVMA